MASINYSNSNTDNSAPQKQFYNFRLFFNPPLEIILASKCTHTLGNNGKKYPQLSTFVQVGLTERNDGQFSRTTVLLTPDDWYRWMITIGELLSKVKSIYIDNHISDTITENDFKIVSYKGEVLQMVPMMAKINEDLVPAVRIIVNDASKFADFPLIDIKSMYNVLNKIDVVTAGMCGCILGESL